MGSKYQKYSVDWLAHEEEKIYGNRNDGKLRSKEEFRLIDLFAGAGGMTLGFTKACGHSFAPIWANDYNQDCVDTYNNQFGDHCICGDIVELLNDRKIRIPDADIVIGGPPCQGFSLLNKNREDDPRKQLWRPFFEVVRRSKAVVFVMENVPQLLGSFEHGEIIGIAEGLGFKLHSRLLLAADYGVPQLRRRAFIIGCKFADPSSVFPPKRTHVSRKPNNGNSYKLDFDDRGEMGITAQWRTVRDAISDLPQPVGVDIRDEKPPLDLHFGRNPSEKSLERYRAVPKEGMNRFDLLRNAPHITPDCWINKKSGGTDLFGRLWWDRPSVTIRTEFYKPEKGRYLHPSQHRPITHREAARLQSFPDDFEFSGTKIEIAKQIGNAVPPLLAARIADSVFLLLSKIRS